MALHGIGKFEQKVIFTLYSFERMVYLWKSYYNRTDTKNIMVLYHPPSLLPLHIITS